MKARTRKKRSGKDADLSVTDGEFYDVLSRPKLVLVDGKAVTLV